ncbi:MAG TPA: hypothetical protein VLY24_13890 [Bryobacteraceae bacterium]|nr:hypothetical protein [Bryobacteraceae bacterium]
MKAHVRRVAAYVAHRLISGSANSAIYDYEEGRYVKFGGSLRLPDVMVLDCDRSCYISGRAAGGKVSLFDFGESSRLTLEFAGDSFQGFDYGTVRPFSGSVRKRLIRVFDYEDYREYRYGF